MKSRKDGMCFEEAVGAAVQAKSTDGLQNLQPPLGKSSTGQKSQNRPIAHRYATQTNTIKKGNGPVAH